MANYADIAGFDPEIGRDMLDMLLGEFLGSGAHRKVYAHRLDETKVIKVEDRGSFQNVLECEIWERSQDTSLRPWLAEVHYMSPNGRILIMDRTYQPKHYPDKLPLLFTDLKYDNFGQIGDRFVCHDYGLTRLEMGMNTRLRKADWWHPK